MIYRPRRWSTARTFVALLVLAAIMSILPSRWTGGLRNLAQPLQWVVTPVSSLTRALTRRGSTLAENTLSPVDAALQEENERLSRQLGHFSLEVAQLREEIDRLSGVRGAIGDENARILIARVVGPVSDGQRDALRLSRGEFQGVTKGQWVVAGLRNADDGLSGRELLARQWLIGRIDEVYTQESVVQLTTDREFREVVQLARPTDDGGWELLPTQMPVYGTGDKLEIRQAAADYLAAGAPIVVAPASSQLPMPMTIGRIVKSERLEATQLHFNLTVQPWGPARQLEYVYIIALAP